MNARCSRVFARFSARVIRLLRRVSIYRRLFFSFLLIIAFTNVVVGSFFYYVSSREISRGIQKNTQQMLGNMVSAIDIKLSRYETLAGSISSSARVRGLLAKCRTLRRNGLSSKTAKAQYQEAGRQLENTLYQFGLSSDVTSVEILNDFDEFTEADYDGLAKGASLSRPEQYRKSRSYQRAIDTNGSPVWCDSSRDLGVFRNGKTEGYYIGNYLTLLESIPDLGPGNELGVIIINVPLTIFDRMADSNLMYDRDEVIFLAGEGGTAAVLNGVYLFRRMPDSETVGALVAMGSGMQTRKAAEFDDLFVCAPVEKLGMSVIYMVEKSRIYQSVNQMRNLMIAVTAVCVLCSLLLSYFVTASISSPMRRLKKAMGQLGESDGLDAEYRDDFPDEIGVLGRQFNRMIRRIRTLLQKLVAEESARKDEQLRRKDAELDALQMQINPHFMYNTLDLIRWNAMFEEKGDGHVSRMLAKFANFLRFNTVRTDRLVKVEEELRHVRAYVDVLSFKEGLRVELKNGIENPDILGCKIPKLTFQPIVENAVKHGVSMPGQKLSISIEAHREGKDLLVRIADDGAGIPAGKLRALNSRLSRDDTSGGGIGLKNVNERIRLHFGDGYGLSVESEEGGYTAVVIRLPA